MSRIGKQPVKIPDSVTFQKEGDKVEIRGPRGSLSWVVPENVSVDQSNGEIVVSAKDNTKKSRELWGTTRSLLSNMVHGVHEGYEKKLEIEGVGYRAELSGNNLILNVGFSHPIEIEPAEGITFSVDKNTITVSGIDKILVGETAAKIRAVKKPEPYKGKGIRYENEFIRRKQGKKAVSAGE